MPDHFHIVITVGREISIERAVQLIKGGFAYFAGKEFGFRPPVWQRDFQKYGFINQGTSVAFKSILLRTRSDGVWQSARGSIRIFPRTPGLIWTTSRAKARE